MYEKHTKVATTFIPGAKNVLLLLLLGPKVPTILLVHVGLLLLWHAKAITTMALKLLIKTRNFLRVWSLFEASASLYRFLCFAEQLSSKLQNQNKTNILEDNC